MSELLQPLPYHLELVKFLKQADPAVWKWFAETRDRADYADSARFDLLKSTYRIDRESHPALYEAADQSCRQLQLDIPIVLYQAQYPVGFNVSLVFIPGELHIVLHGDLSERLSADELKAVFAHECGHYVLLNHWEREFRIADEMISAMCNDERAHSAYRNTQRLFQLYTEIFCDRASLAVTNNLSHVVSALVKIETNVLQVNPESYVKQADEIFSKGGVVTAQMTHPETFIRARAARLWLDDRRACEQPIREMIEGNPGLDQLDVLGQRRLEELTGRIIRKLLSHRWFQSDPIIAHAKSFFADFQPSAKLIKDASLADDVGKWGPALQDYLSFLLLDFLAADRDLEELPVALGLQMAEEFQIKDRFIELLRQELRLRKTVIDRIDREKEQLLKNANVAEQAT